MAEGHSYDAVVVGAGPNGLAAAAELARAGRSVFVAEAAPVLGGGARTEELTLPGFLHDSCSGVHPMGVASPFLRSLPLAQHGLEWVHPEVPMAHPLDDGPPVMVHRSVDETARGLGDDASAYRRIMAPLVRRADRLAAGYLGLLHRPRHPIVLARFGVHAVRSAERLSRSRFEGERARAVLAGNAAHAISPLDRALTGGFALLYNILAHHVGWPFARGGSQSVADALAAYVVSQGGIIECDRKVTRLGDLPAAKVILLDLAPRQVLTLAGDLFPPRYRRALERFRYGSGVFKIDWALDAPIPWKEPECLRAGTFHLGGSLEEIAAAEKAVARGEHPERPWVIVAQQSLFDPSRAPAGKHTAWAYTHVPNGSTVDMTALVEDQIERFAPGFRDVVLARHVRTASDLDDYNPNYVGGDIAAGAATFRQMLGRPAVRWSPHSTPDPRIFICSSSTSPGPGVHGMCGYHAARAALRRIR